MAFLAIALLPLILVSLITYYKYKSSLETIRINQLTDLVEVKSERLEEYFSRLKAEIEMAVYFYNIQKNLPILIQYENNPKSQEFRGATFTLNKQLVKMQEALKLSGIILINPKGRVVYGSDSKYYEKYLFKPLTGVGAKAFTEGKKGIGFSDIFFSEMPGNKLHFFISAPLYDLNQKFIGVISFEVSMSSIDAILQDTTGLGKTGESLVGKIIGNEIAYLGPLKYDSDAAFKRRVQIGGVLGGPIQEAVKGKIGSGQSIDYRGEPVIAAWRPISMIGWGLVSKIDTKEAFADAIRLRNLMFVIWGIIFILGGIVAIIIARSISGPIKKLSIGAEHIGSGNLDFKVATCAKDEVGQLSRSFDKMIDNLKEVLASKDELNKEIVERKHVEEALRASEERWSTTLSSIGDGVIATDNHGRITFMNYVAESITGWGLSEANGLHITEVFNIVDEQTRRKVENPAIKALSFKIVVALANHPILISKDGIEVPIDDSGAPIKDRNGNVIGSVLIFRDITERRQSEKAKNHFIAVLAHELRNPLAPLYLAIQKIELYAWKNSEENTDLTMDTILKSSTQIALRQISNMTRLLDDLLDLSRIEQGKIHLKIEKIDLKDPLEYALALVHPIIEERGHSIEVTLPDEPITLEADPLRIEQIAVNLLNNAAKYTDYGGHIWCEVSRENNWAKITVRDDGIGIPADKIRHIFDPFFQTETALNRSQNGLGLGLMLVKSLIKMHNGTIDATSPGEGRGSEFVVRLPVLPVGTVLSDQENSTEIFSDESSSKNKKKILVVDDNQSLACLMQDLLEHLGHEVILANDGRSAVRLARKKRPDVILCDIGLPGMDGYEVARMIRKEEYCGKRAVMVAVTGFGQDTDKQYAYDAGFDFHVTKPVGVEVLNQIVCS